MTRLNKKDFYSHIDSIQLNRLDTENFEIWLAGESKEYDSMGGDDYTEPGVEYQMATRLIQNIRILSLKDRTRPILIHMKTCGGYWEEGMAIHNAIQFCPNLVTILSYTHARSMSSLIIQAADKRVLMPDSYFLFHEGTLGADGTSKQVKSFVKWTEKIIEPRMLDIYVEVLKRKGKYVRRSPQWIREMLQECMNQREDVYLTAQEAVEWGFADEIFDGEWDRLKTRYPRRRAKKR